MFLSTLLNAPRRIDSDNGEIDVGRRPAGWATDAPAPCPHRVAVVGAGRLGTTFAYSLLLGGLVGELVLIDVDRQRAEVEAMDLNHAVPLSNPARIWAGEYADCAGADVVVVTAGVPSRQGREAGERPMDRVRRRAALVRDVLPRIAEHNRQGILLVAAEPVDVLSYVAWKASGLPAERVIGSGTVLDTARFRTLLAQHLGIDARDVHAHVIGGHGDGAAPHTVPVWSMANVTGIGLETYCRRHGCELDDEQRRRIFGRTRDAGCEIADRNGTACYAVAAGLLRIVESILRDQYSVLPVSNLAPGSYGLGDLYLSLPAVVARAGVEQTLHLPLDAEERRRLRDSAAALRRILAELDR